jgi:hypothetical protein
VTPKPSLVAAKDATAGRTGPDGDDDRSAEFFLFEERRDGDDSSVIYFARVREPERLLNRRGMHFHGDVVEALSDLVLSFVRGDPSNGTDSRGR